MTIIIPYYQGVQPELLSHSSFWAWWVAEMCLAREFLDNLISYCWRKCVSSCCWSWHCWLSPEASCAPHSATSPSRTLWQPLSSPVHLLYSSTTQKGKTTYIFLAVKLAQEISALKHSHYAVPPRGSLIILLRQSDGMVLLALPWPHAVAVSLVPSLNHTWSFLFVMSQCRELTCREITHFNKAKPFCPLSPWTRSSWVTAGSHKEDTVRAEVRKD